MSRRKIKCIEPNANAVFVRRDQEYEQSIKQLKKLLPSNHGGKRKGAGRPKKEPTKVMRIPISLISHVQGLIKKA